MIKGRGVYKRQKHSS